MANLTKRIIDLQTTSTLGSDDYVMVDGATNGTKKYLLKDILDEIEDIKEGTALATGAVTTDKLAAGAVTNAKIGDGAVDTTNIADDAVTAAKIDDGAVGTDALAAGAVTGAKIAAGAVGTSNIASGAVTLDKIASDSNATSSRNGLMSSADKAKLDGFSAASNYALKSDIVGAYIFKGSVNTENDLPSTGLTVGDVYNIIAASSYGESGANVAWTGSAWDALGESFDISDGAIDTEQLADGAVTNGKLATEAKTTISPTIIEYTDPTYGSGTRQGYDATFGNSGQTIMLPKVNSGLLIDVENIPTIPEKKIGYGAVTANKIAAGAVGTEKLANSAVTTDKLATAAVSTDKIASLAVTTNKIAAGAVDNSKLANNAVGTAQIANGAVTSEKLDSDIIDTIDSKAAASDVTALQEHVDEELENKADIDGYYSQLTAGLAENLIGRGDAVPAEYLYRTAGGTADIEDGIATIDCIKGNTLVWNQYVPLFNASGMWGAATGSTSEILNDGRGIKLTCNNSSSSILKAKNTIQSKVSIPSGHTWYIACTVDATGTTANPAFGIYIGASSGAFRIITTAGVKQRYAGVATATGSEMVLSVRLAGATPVGEYAIFSDFIAVDLTTMFGAGNEPDTVEEFEAMYPESYYPHSAPKLLPVDIRGIETVGFNQWDEEWESGQYSTSTGEKGNNANRIRSKNYIPAMPSTEYRFTMDADVANNAYVLFYDGSKSLLGTNYVQISTSTGLTFTTPSNCRYMTFFVWSSSAVTSYSGGICINLSWSGYRNGEYEEHWSAERPIDTSRFFPTGMKKVGDKADALYADHYDTVIGSVDLGTLTWQYLDNYAYFRALVTPTRALKSDMVCDKYQYGGLTYDSPMANAATGIYSQYTSRYIYVKDTTYTDAVTFKAAMNGVTCFYVLETPTTTEIDPPLNLSYKVSDFGTERIMVDETADAPQTAPVPMEVEYGLNAIDTIRRLPEEYQSHKSMGQFTEALESSLGVEITETWDEDDQRYEYEISDFELADGAVTPQSLSDAVTHNQYPSLSVGRADSLTGADSTAQWATRESTGSGAATVRSVQGNTVTWEQLYFRDAGSGTVRGISYTIDANGLITLNGTVSQVGYILAGTTVAGKAGHKYLMHGHGGNFDVNKSVFSLQVSGGNDNANSGLIVSLSSDASLYPAIALKNVGDTLTNVTFRPQLFDLTQMFGAGNEPQSVAEFEAMYPEAYYPYSAPTLKPVQIAGIRSVGFNQLSADFTPCKAIDGSGQIAAHQDDYSYWATENYVPVLGSTVYYAKLADRFTASTSSIAIAYYDSAKSFISRASGVNNTTFTTPSNARYIRLQAYFTTAQRALPSGICINISDPALNGQYEPYTTDSAEWTTQTLRAAGSVADMLYSDHVDVKVGAVDLGTLTWTRAADGKFYAAVSGIRLYVNTISYAQIANAKYEVIAPAGVSSDFDKAICQRGSASSNNQVMVFDSAYTDAATFKAAMDGVLLFYELAAPTTQPISPALPMTYRVEQGGSESIIVPDGEVSAVPVITVAEGESAADVVMDALACIATPDGPVATANHALGTYLTMQGKLYKVTSAIAVGESIVAGTNVTETTVMAELIARTA